MKRKNLLDGHDFARRKQLEAMKKDELIEYHERKRKHWDVSMGVVVLLLFVAVIGSVGCLAQELNEQRDYYVDVLDEVGKDMCNLHGETYYDTYIKGYPETEKILIRCYGDSLVVK